MRFELFTLSAALMVVLLALTACQAAEQLEALEPTIEAAIAEELAPPATEEAPTPEPTLAPAEEQTVEEVESVEIEEEQPAEEMAEFTATTDLFSLRVPPDWVAEEHADGAGVIMASSAAALARFSQGAEMEPEDLTLNISLTPTEMFEVVGLSVEPGSTTEALVAAVMPAFSGVKGTEASETKIIALDDGREVALTMASNPAAEGALVLFEVAEGVVALSTIAGPPGELDFEDLEMATRLIIASLNVKGTVEQLFEAINPPLPPDFVAG